MHRSIYYFIVICDKYNNKRYLVYFWKVWGFAKSARLLNKLSNNIKLLKIEFLLLNFLYILQAYFPQYLKISLVNILRHLVLLLWFVISSLYDMGYQLYFPFSTMTTKFERKHCYVSLCIGAAQCQPNWPIGPPPIENLG